jgi:hypothetical protein
MPVNCWEHNKCGRHPDDEKNSERICPSSVCEEFHGVNRGHMGGRYCWRVPGSTCRKTKKPTPHWADSLKNCLGCPFFNLVRDEEGKDFRI